MSARPSATASPAEGHNQFLDFIRTVAIVRVLAWHTYGYAWLSYLVASMPAMFFVAGALMSRSLSRGSWRKVLFSRFRRLLIPLWAFALVAVTVMTLHSYYGSELGRPMHRHELPWWLIPIWDPRGSDWGITFWAVLWYLRCLTWLLLLSPVLLWLFRRISIALIGLPLGLMVVFEQRLRAGHEVPWQLQDLALFGIFWLLGFAYDAGMLAPVPRRARAAATAIFAAAAAAWVLTQDVPGNVVNASYPAHLFVGLAWLALALTFEAPIAAFASRKRPSAFMSWVNDRVFTIYLWHAAGLFASYEVLFASDRPEWLRVVGALPLVLAVTFAAELAFGWVEDLAARRRPHFLPGSGERASHRRLRRWTLVSVPLAAGLGVAALFAALLVEHFQSTPSLSTSAAAVPPSGAGIAIRAQRAKVLDAPPPVDPPMSAPGNQPLEPVTAEELQVLLDQWRAENGLEGTVLAIHLADGSHWAGASGDEAGTNEAIPPTYVYHTASVTKTFTTALILQLAEQGLVGLDDKASMYVPGVAHSDQYTVRNLIQHTSGLPATDGVAPDEALLEAEVTPLAFEPGSSYLYSSPGYYMLGLIIEAVTGESYTAALHERLLKPLGLTSSFMDEELAPLPESTHPAWIAAAGAIRSGAARSSTNLGYEYHGTLWSSAGLQSTAGDLAAWAIDLWDSNRVVNAATRDEMTKFLDVTYQYAGLATYPFCPCWMEDGRMQAERWGHYGRSGVLEYDPRDRIAVAIYTSGTDIDERLIVAYDDLSKRVRSLVRGRGLAAFASQADPPAHVTPAAMPPHEDRYRPEPAQEEQGLRPEGDFEAAPPVEEEQPERPEPEQQDVPASDD